MDFDGGSLWGIDEEENLDEEQLPPELTQFENEAFAMHFKARQKIAEVKKLRQYFKRPDADEQKRLLAEKMKTSPCHKCGELGHWSRECPQKGTHGVNNAGTKTDDSEWATLAALCTFSPEPKSAGSRYEGHWCGAVSRSADVFGS